MKARPREILPLILVPAFLGVALLGCFCGNTHALEPGPIPQWIWSDSHHRPGERVVFQNVVSVTEPVRKATLWVLADDSANIAVNGQRIASSAQFRKIEPVDVTAELKQGKNTLEIVAINRDGAAGVLLSLQIEYENGGRHRWVTDPTWRASRTRLTSNLSEVEKSPTDETVADSANSRFAESLGLLGSFPWGNPVGESEDYYQWKKALGVGTASDAASISILPGFEVTLVRSSAPGEGSWVSLTFDPKGRAIIGREGKGLLRYQLPPHDKLEVINNTLEECRGVLFAHDSLYANANNSRGLYRLRDTDEDDQFDDVRLLRTTPGGVGHGRNGLALGPDGMIYSIHGNNVRLPVDFVPAKSPLQRLAEDRLIPCDWDRFLFDPDAKVPAGHVIRTDPEGKTWELVAGGLRNPYGIDFNRDGEMFTFDADNEGDIGTPWYRPNRINHLVSGGDYGFRHGTANRHRHFAEHLPATVDIGLGSPTGVRFGHRGNFPGRYNDALYALDWSYGRIYCIHLIPRGASYVAQVEKLLEGQPLNVTDLAFGPDGALYFVTGGRGTQSGLYRVAWTGDASKSQFANARLPANEAAQEARTLRRRLESRHGSVHSFDRDENELLTHADPWIQHAARVAVEFQDDASHDALWETIAKSQQSSAAQLAMSRIGTTSEQHRLQQHLFNQLQRDHFPLTTENDRLNLLRILSISLAREGKTPNLSDRDWAESLKQYWPDNVTAETAHISERLVQRVCELAVYFQADWIVAAGLRRAEMCPRAEDQLLYLFTLRTAKNGWTKPLRRQYFELLKNLDHHLGGNLLPVSLDLLRKEMLESLGADERAEFDRLFTDEDASGLTAAEVLQKRPLVKNWKATDIPEILATTPRKQFAMGQKLFRETLCIRCHRVAGEGGAFGPELNQVANRFGPKDLLEMVIDPSRTIDEKYRQTQIETTAGKIMTGRLVGGDDQSVLLAMEALAPRRTTKIPRNEIAIQTESTTSPMPTGLLDSLTADEIRELLQYLQAGGNPDHPLYRQP